MNKEKFFNILFYGFVSFCSVLMFVCSICYLVYAERYKNHLENCPNCPDMNLTYNLSTADINSSGPFESNNILIPVGGYYNIPQDLGGGHSLRQDQIYCFSFTVYILSDGNTFTFKINPIATLYNNQNVYSRSNVSYGYTDYTSFDYWLGGYMDVGSAAVGSGAFNSVRYSFKVSPGFVSSISSFTYLVNESGFGDSDLGQVKLVFYDVNDNSLELVFAYDKDNYQDVLKLCPTRTITVGSYSDNDYYNAGYTDGYNTGNNTGYNSGYDVGFSSGQTVGYANGYSVGVDDANTYSFGNFFTAIVDAPVSVFMSCLNFDIMGFNMLDFVFGLLTVCIIILVIKLMLGGK